VKVLTEHAYLQNSTKLSSHQHRLIKQYIKESKDAQIARGLKVLSQALHDHHEKKVWILIDEYDAVANIAYRKFDTDNLDKTIKLFSRIYETALKGNSCLEKGVLTGVQYIAQSGMLSGLNNLGKFDFTSAKYAQHYGIDQNEVDLFFDHFSVPKIPGNSAKLWYNGYKVKKYCPKNPEVHLKEIVGKYNIWSIVSYLKEGEFNSFKSYWEKSGNIDFIDALFTKPEVREKVETLVDGESIYLVRKDDFSVNDFVQLKNMIGGNKEITPGGLSVLFSYLFIGGYLTIDGKTQNYYQLPNMEINYEMGQKLIDYYKTICTIDPQKIQGLTNILQSVMNIKESDQNNIKGSFKNFYDQFKEIIKGITLVNDKNDEGVFTNEDVVHSILNYIVLQTQHSTFGSEIYTNKLHSDKKGRADIKITNDDVGIIIEVKCVPVPNREDGHMKEAIEQAISYCNLLKNTNNNIFVAINVDRKMKTPEEGSIELLCAYNMFDKKEVFGIDVLGEDNTFGVSSDFMESFIGDA
jgi:DNA-binding XRE family transcriptional regulator